MAYFFIVTDQLLVQFVLQQYIKKHFNRSHFLEGRFMRCIFIELETYKKSKWLDHEFSGMKFLHNRNRQSYRLPVAQRVAFRADDMYA